MNLGLSEAALIERRNGIGGSDAAAIIAGGESWYELWLDKTGQRPPRKIMGDWDSALRHTTEGLQLDWYAHITGSPATRRGEVVISQDFPILRCTLDGYDVADDLVIQAKHVSSFTPNAINWCLEHYSPQLNHEAMVCKAKGAVMTIIVGMAEPIHRKLTFDPFFAEAYLDRARAFWSYVEMRKEPPGDYSRLAVPLPESAMKEISMDGNNAWADAAARWKDNKDAAAKFEGARADLKKLLASDVKTATGHGVIASRDKRGLTIKSA